MTNKIIKTFEAWNDNIIDNSLFVSGRAKYNPKVVGNTIRYSTGTSEPYYYAVIEKKGGRFICKIYKRKKDGEEIRLRNKIKKNLKLAHNYVREFLNQKLKKDKKKKEKDKPIEKQIQPTSIPEPPVFGVEEPPIIKKKGPIIRRFI